MLNIEMDCDTFVYNEPWVKKGRMSVWITPLFKTIYMKIKQNNKSK